MENIVPSTGITPATTAPRSVSATAVVDWVSLDVTLARSSNGAHLWRSHNAIGVSYVEPLNEGPGRAASAFRIRLQAPGDFKTIESLTEALEASHGLVSPARLHALEVSVDFSPRLALPGSMRGLTTRLMSSITPPILNSPRLSDGSITELFPSSREPNPEMTLYVGNDDDDLMWRVYWKRTDETFRDESGARVPRPIPAAQHRARAEVRLQGAALDSLSLTTLSDLGRFRFESLYSLGYFKFCRPRCCKEVLASNPYSAFAAAGLGVTPNSPAFMLGRFGRFDTRGRKRRLSPNLATDTELGEAARSALRSLTRRF